MWQPVIIIVRVSPHPSLSNFYFLLVRLTGTHSRYNELVHTRSHWKIRVYNFIGIGLLFFLFFFLTIYNIVISTRLRSATITLHVHNEDAQRQGLNVRVETIR